MSDPEKTGLRAVRSYVRRAGRLTRAQARALEELWPRYGIEHADTRLRFREIFGRRAPVVLEIGFGDGETLARQAQAEPEKDFLGIEVHRPGVGHLLLLIERQEIGNLRLICDDAVAVLEHRIPPGALQQVNLFFPDPWPKKRHHKRRIVRPGFVALLADRLTGGGILQLTTDWEDYAQWMLETVEGNEAFVNLAGRGRFSTGAGTHPETKFARRGLRLGHRIWNLQFRRK